MISDNFLDVFVVHYTKLEERKKWVKVGDKYMETNEKSSPSPIRFAYKTKKKEE
jgi:hypothetical protein